jgi:hypothetical protein
VANKLIDGAIIAQALTWLILQELKLRGVRMSAGAPDGEAHLLRWELPPIANQDLALTIDNFIDKFCATSAREIASVLAERIGTGVASFEELGLPGAYDISERQRDQATGFVMNVERYYDIMTDTMVWQVRIAYRVRKMRGMFDPFIAEQWNRSRPSFDGTFKWFFDDIVPVTPAIP